MGKKPICKTLRKHTLGFAAHENAHVPGRQLQLRIVLCADVFAQISRHRCRYNVIVACIDIEDRHRHVRQLYPLGIEEQLVNDKAVILVEVLDPLLCDFAGVMWPICDPLLHSQEIQKLFFVICHI